MGRKKRGKGTVNGQKFENWRKMFWLIIQNFFRNNPNITFEEFTSDIGKYNIYSINEENERSLIKTKESYEKFPNYKNKYGETPIIIEGKEYYFKTEVGDEKGKFIDFAKDHGIVVELDEDNFDDNQAKCIEE